MSDAFLHDPEESTGRLDTAARALVDARREKDETAAKATAAEKRYRELEAHFWAAFDDLGMTTTTLDLGPGYGKVQFQKRETVTANVLNAEELAKTLAEEDLTHLLGPASVRKKALNELIRQRRKSGEEIPAGAEPSVRRYVTIGLKGGG